MTDSLRDFINRALGLLGPDAEAQALFATEIAWLEERLAIWERQEWRVALIGITSSGKSTLVNALLSNKLLPAKVRPTSNSLVVCRQGSPASAVIHYHERHSETIDEAAIGPTLSRLTDERTNPDNCLEVREIELFWPHFRLGAGVALVDTPGLDAYQLERHEELTLQFLLPSVDAVCFLTTAKANADSRISNYLDIISSHGKPLVLVQNMIDSIVPKLGLGGRVERTVGEVAEDHANRLRKLLFQSTAAVRNAPVIQVSAIWALQGALDQSGIPELVQTLASYFDKLKPRLAKGRLQQLQQHLSKIVSNERATKTLPSLRNQLEREEREIEAYRDRLAEHLKDFSLSLESLSADLEKEASIFLTRVNSLKPNDVKNAEELEKEIEAWCGKIPGLIGERVKVFHENTISLGRDLNLGDEDFRFDAPRGPAVQRLHVPVKSKSRTFSVEKDGFFAWAARKLRLGGYSERTERWLEVNRKAYSEAVDELTTSRRKWASNASKEIKENAASLCRPLQAELERRKDSLKARLSTQMGIEARLAIADRLAALCLEIEETIATFPEVDDQDPVTLRRNMENPQVERLYPPFVLELVTIAHEISMRRYRRLRDEMCFKVKQRFQTEVTSSLILGGDTTSMERFLALFWRDEFPSWSCPGAGLHLFDTAYGSVAIALNDENDSDLLRQVTDFTAGGSMVYLLLDAEQPGSTMNQLWRSGAVDVLRNARGLILVIQEIRGLENAGQIASAVRQMRVLADNFEFQVDGLLANCGNAVASAVVDRLFLRGDELRTIHDEREWIAELGIGAEAYVARVLRGWREEEVHCEEE